jgi:putative ABC transport system substrate-binding protein
MAIRRIRRREFVATPASAMAWPVLARAQKPMPVIGVLGPQSREAAARNVAGFHRGLNESGYVEGKNVAIEYRWADGQNTRLPSLAADLVQHRVAVIVTAGGTPPLVAAKAATSAIPIVFQIGTDPVAFGSLLA